MTRCFVRGVSVFGPGLAGWLEARRVLRGEARWNAYMPVPPLPAMLAPNERRRSGVSTRLALAVCEEAASRSGLPAAELAGVFASSNGEGTIVHGLLETLAGADPLLSPTQFHNSVHNAVAGYWSIGAGSMAPVTCLACHDETFGCALMQAASGVSAGRDVLLCVYDAPIPPPLGDARPTFAGFASAAVLSQQPGQTPIAELQLDAVFGLTAPTDLPRMPELAPLVAGNAAARALRLLESVAMETADRFSIGLPSGYLTVELRPC